MLDMSQYLGTFLEESREHLQSLNDNLLLLETDPSSPGIVDSIFRSAHTLKGMSATMGFNVIAELTHQMENVLQKIRSGEIPVTEPTINVLFKCLDALEAMVNDVSAGGEGKQEIGELLAMLRGEKTDEKGGEATPAAEAQEAGQEEATGTSVCFNEYEKNLLDQAISGGFNIFHLVITIKPSCVMKAARAYMVFRVLEDAGEIIKSVPKVQDIEDEKFEDSFHLVYVTREDTDCVRKALDTVAELDEPRIIALEGNFGRYGMMAGAAGEAATAGEGASATAPASSPEGAGEAAPAGGAPGAGAAATTAGAAAAKFCAVAGQQTKATATAAKKVRAGQTVRVDIERLDKLMNLVGELVINKTRLEQIGRVNPNPDLNETLEHMDRLTTDLQNIVMTVRMVPIEQVFSRFPRMVRDLAHDLGKEIEFIIEGKETELDRTVIDEIGDPLVHLLRNSIDHGIEMPEEREEAGKARTGTVRLVAKHEGNNVIIEVTDNGKGINPQSLREKAIEKGIISELEASQLDENAAVRLIFHAGFSMAKKVTDVSGRGVGLDAVKTKIEALSGEVQVDSRVGEGSRFRIQLPLTLAIIQALLVKVGPETYAIPLASIAETTSIFPDQIKMVQEQEVTLLRQTVLPLVRLHEVLEVPGDFDPEPVQELFVVVVNKADKRIGLVVDNLIGQQEIVIKPLGNLLAGLPSIAGATILGNGQVSLILDIPSLF